MRYFLIALTLFLIPQYTPSQATTKPSHPNHHLHTRALQQPRVGIIFSLPQTQLSLKDLNTQLPWLANVSHKEEGGRVFFYGDYRDKHIVLCSLWPTKVNAAIVTSNMILKQNVDIVLIIGSCYSRDPQHHLFDILLSKGYLHHDTDLRPILNKFETPDQHLSVFRTSPMFFKYIKQGGQTFLEQEKTNIEKLLKKHGFLKEHTQSLHTIKEGIVATGEPFSLSRKYFHSLQQSMPEIVGFDNAGCAIAQVCHEYNIPCLGVNIIEPHPIESPSQESWSNLLQEVRLLYTKNLVQHLLQKLEL